MDYQFVYPWAKGDVLHEIYVFTSIKLEKFRHAQALSHSKVETNIVVVPYGCDEPFCKDCQNEKPFSLYLRNLI